MKNIKKFSVKSLSVLLAVLIALFSLPLTAFAVSFEQTPPSSGESSVTKKEIIELRELRDAKTKHFRLEDGTFYAAQYDSAVHYLDENGEWQDIDNTLSESGDTYATNDQKIKFAKKTNGSGEIFTLHDGNRKLTLTLQGANKKISGIVTNNETEFSDGTSKITKMTTLDKISASILYADILENTDLEYVVNSGNIKENIIVKAKAANYSYVFSMSLNNLSAEMNENGEIEICDPSTGELAYRIPAPFMCDASGEYSSNITLALESSGGNGKYILTVTADAEWINAEDRAFPVTIDPPLNTVPTANSVYCTYIDSTVPNSNYGSDAYAYVGSTQKTYWQLNSLPTIPSSAYITDARFTATAYSGGAIGGYVGVYGVYEYWDEGHNQSAYDEGGLGMHNSDFTDFQYVYESSSFYIDKDYTFNITPLVRDWYEYDNYGLVLAPVSGQSFNGSVAFYSDDYSVAGVVPRLTVSYRDIKGLESYWTAAGQDAGFAGAGAVNLASGGLTVSVPTLTTTDALMPISASLVYNSASKLAGDSYMANGFMLNLCEQITRGSYADENGTSQTYYKWRDGDGTEHWLMPTSTSGVFEDEDGLLLTLNVTSSGYTLTDDSDTVRTFNSYGYLTGITDKLGNRVDITLASYAQRPTAVTLTPKGGTATEQLVFGYSGTRLNLVRNPASGEAVIIRYTTVLSSELSDSFDAVSSVIRAHSPSNTASASDWASFASGSSTSGTSNITVDAIASYAYDGYGRMTAVTNGLTNYSLNYEYNTFGKVNSVRETANGTAGQTVSFAYYTTNTVVRTSGGDDVHGNTDDLLTTYVFDSYGRAVSTYATDTSGAVLHGAASTQYVGEENEKAKNSIKQSVSVSDQSPNYLYNGGFESGITGWSRVGGSFTATDNANAAQNGAKYADLLMYTDTASARIYQNVNLKKGTYTFSAYINTYNTEGVSFYLKATSASNSAHSVSERVPVNNKAGGNTYSFVSVTFTADPTTSGGTETFEICLEAQKAVGNSASVKIDSLMLSKGTGVSDFAAIDFGHFESSDTSRAPSADWRINGEGVTSSYDITLVNSGSLFGTALKMNGGVGIGKYVKQRLYAATTEKKDNFNGNLSSGVQGSRTYVISGWANAAAPSYSDASQFSLRVRVKYYNGSDSDLTERLFEVPFDRSIRGWQFVSGSFEIDPSLGLVNSVDIEIAYDNNSSYAYFDNIAVVSGIGNFTSYRYNAKGYVTEITDGLEYVWNMYGSDGNAKNVTRSFSTADNTATAYTYNAYDQVTAVDVGTYSGSLTWSSTADQIDGAGKVIGVEYYTVYEYDANNGLLLSEMTYDYDTNEYLFTFKERSTSGHIFGAVTAETTEMGTTYYFYDTSNGRLMAVRYPEGNGVVYSYDGIGNLTSVLPITVSTSSSSYSANTNAESVSYGYDSAKRLSSVITRTSTYNFTYDTFGNTSSVKAGGQTLASYTYNSYNGKIATMTYGNGLSIKYLYDSLDRVKEIQYNTGSGGAYEAVIRYEYDNAGRMHSVTDVRSNETTYYVYEPSGKILQTVVSDSSAYSNLYSEQYTYNEKSQLVYSTENFGYRYISSGMVNTHESVEYNYLYNEDGTLKLMTAGNGYFAGSITPSYDNLGRTTQRVYQYSEGSSARFYGKANYTYKPGTALVSQYTFSRGLSSGNLGTSTYNYTYDDNGNITQITDANGVIQNKYYYDDLGQLIREDNRALGMTYVWTYDRAGNILTVEYADFTTSASYDLGGYYEYEYASGTWGDRLTSANGWVYTYDAIGNPLTKTNSSGTQGYRYVWEGRRLVEVYQCWYDEGTLTYDECIAAYTYNADGIRTKKNSNEYLLDGTRIVSEGGGNLVYIYDETGSPIGVKYRTLAYAEGAYDYFFYEKNLQGDIVAIYNENGTKIATYTYDAWGNFVKSQTSGVTYSTADTYVYNNNPFTYRGYYYDSETGWYYLQTRYYDPTVGRFISQDSALYSSMLGFNMYAYCENNPVNYLDPSGESGIAAVWATWASAGLALVAADGLIPVGDIIYVAGNVVLGIAYAVEVVVLAEKIDEAFENDNSEPVSIPIEDPSDVNLENKNSDKDSRLKGKPGETKKEGNKETKIGSDGRASEERHWTDHGHPKQHTNPHDHDISWGNDGKPQFGPPKNYWDGNIPIF